MKPSIVLDTHEKRTKVFKYIDNSCEIEYRIKPLFIGDYIAGGVVIERKTISDFLNSMVTGRLKEQVRKLQDTEKRLLIIEGPINSLEGIEKRRVYGNILSLLLYKNLKILFTENAWDTYQILAILSIQKAYSDERALTSATTRLPKPREVLKHDIISNIYGIGPVTAKKLIEKFKSIQNIINAKESELEEIIGKRTKQFLELVRD